MRLVLIGLLVLSTLIAAGGAFAQDRIALVIGNSDYAMPGWRLDNPTRDATEIDRVLKQVGFETELLVDASENEIEAALRRFKRRLQAAGRAGTGLFYFAGHGVQSEGENLLVPVDAVDVKHVDDLWSQSIRLNDVTKTMELSGNGTNFVIIDACRDNYAQGSSRSGSRGFAAVESSRGMLIAFATAPGSVAEDGAGRNSPYSSALLKYIPRPGLSAEELFRNVANEVESQTAGRQQPWIESALRGKSFCFAGCERNAAIEPVTETAPTDPPLESVSPDVAKMHGVMRDITGFAFNALKIKETATIAGQQSVRVGDQVSTCAYRYNYRHPEKTTELLETQPPVQPLIPMTCPPTSFLINKDNYISVTDSKNEIQNWRIVSDDGKTIVARGTGELATPIAQGKKVPFVVTYTVAKSKKVVENISMKSQEPVPVKQTNGMVLSFEIDIEINFDRQEFQGTSYPRVETMRMKLTVTDPPNLRGLFSIESGEEVTSVATASR